MDGLALAQAIRADPALASTCLVLLAAATTGERGALARQVAIDASLTKPVTRAHLDAGGGGESGIRTHGTLLTYTRFPSVRLKPLGHLFAREF
jgi:CheY-like chemotaxis protein